MTKSQDNRNGEPVQATGRQSEEEDVQTAEWLSTGMQRFDDAFEPGTPSLAQLTSLVDAARKEARSKLWRDLALLWSAACVVLGGMAFAWTDNVLWVVGIQAVGAVAGVACLGGLLARRSGKGLKGKWTN